MDSSAILGSPRALALRLGAVQLETNLLLAPIAGYCDLAFRLVCRSFNEDPHAAAGFSRARSGLGLACTDLLSPQGLLRGTAASLDLAATNDADKPVGMQLYGSDPGLLAEGARWAADHGATVVDINMGCPVDKVTKKDGGSKLMVPDEGIDASGCRSFSKALSIARAVRAALPGSVPLTAKMRLGWRCSDDAPKLAVALVEAGVAGVTVHGRTTEQRFRGEADWARIGDVVEAVGDRAPVIGNGDVRTARDAVRMVRETGCAGVMIGRGALSHPWVFRDAWSLMTTGVVPPEPTALEQLAVIRRFFGLMEQERGERYAVGQINRRISWLGKPLGRAARLEAGLGPDEVKAFREGVRLAGSSEEVLAALGALDGLLEAGGEKSRERAATAGAGPNTTVRSS